MRGVNVWKVLSILFLLISFSFTACDKPVLDVYPKEYSIGAEGGELSVLVYSTGVDKVIIPEGSKDWLSLEEVVETKALPVYKEHVILIVQPNTEKVPRKAKIVLKSFNNR
mgnify:CR=1 FL=1